MGSELEAGPEMDRAVAEACGAQLCLGFDEHDWDFGDFSRIVRFWRPSIDWNDAMIAAEKINLAFNLHREHSIEHGWIYAISIPASHGQIFAGSGASGPELICLAILRVKHA